VVADTDLIKSTLAMAVLAVVPLGVSLATFDARHAKIFGWLSLLQPFAAAGALLALTLEPRGPTGLFVVPWLGFTFLAGLLGAFGLRERKPGQNLAHSLALLLLPIGGAWLFVSRAGFDPLGHGALIVLLTAVHFHFAAFGALIVLGCNHARLSGLIQRRVQSAALQHFPEYAAVAVVVATFLVAIGISGARFMGVVGAALLSLALFVHALLHLSFVLKYQRGGLVKLLLVVSSVSVLGSMPLACAWALGQWTGTAYIDFTSMLRLHGMANAHGFVFCGLLGFWLDARSLAKDTLPHASAADESSPDLVGSGNL
jgi:hypothetical protein